MIYTFCSWLKLTLRELKERLDYMKNDGIVYGTKQQS